MFTSRMWRDSREAGGIARMYLVSRNRLRHNAARSCDGAFAQGYTRHQDTLGSGPGTIL